MASPEEILAALSRELPELNTNLRELRAEMSRVRVAMKESNFKALPVVAKQLALLNQILLQTSKAAGTAGMIGQVLNAVTELARRTR